MSIRLFLRKMHPATITLISFGMVIAAGTGLLLIPVATGPEGISFIDALFTATSAVCVTGLTVVDTGSCFTGLGQATVLTLIQLGGLGIMTFSVVLFTTFGKRISVKQRLILKEVFTFSHQTDVLQLVKSIFFYTGLVEVLGAVFLFISWYGEFPFWQNVWLSAFHSISSFCNAGFSLFSDNLVAYQSWISVNLIVCGLIVFGGIGFPVVHEIYERMAARGKVRRKVSVQTRSVALTTLLLIVSGTLIVLWSERSFLLAEFSTKDQILVALFHSVTARTAGFNTVDVGLFQNSTVAFLMFLMFIGASPGSCGGGVKTTTLAVLGAFTWNRFRHRRFVNMFKRTIPDSAVTASVSLVVLSMSLISVIFFLLLLHQQSAGVGSGLGREFVEYLFEVVSAFGTVGLSMGATAKLGTLGKVLIILMMFIGRVGVFTFAYFLTGSDARNGIQYTQQNLMIG